MRFPARDRITFLLIVKGECWGYFGGEEPVHFATGDIGLLAVPRTFVLCSDLSVPPVDATTLFTLGRTKVQLGDGEDFAYLGGHVMLDPLRGRLVMDVMPPWMHIQASSPQANILRWLVDQLAAEQAAEQPGAQLASAQLTQLLFIQILRAHLKSADLIPVGWLRALADSRLAPALRLMHDDPGRDWHLDELAKASAMSRTTFALHFRTAAGVAPLTYLTGWRMRLAERALRDETTPWPSLPERSVTRPRAPSAMRSSARPGSPQRLPERSEDLDPLVPRPRLAGHHAARPGGSPGAERP